MGIKEITTGQDSFLDIVANLVGILIILVVVVSAQASTAPKPVVPKADLLEKISTLETEISSRADVVSKLETDNHQLELQIIKENRLAAGLTDQRHQMLVQLEIVKQQMAKQRLANEEKLAAFNAEQKEKLKKQSEFEVSKRLLERELAELNREKSAVQVAAETIVPNTKTIDHFPNPIAKTVFSNEVHFRLANGKLSYIPMDELIAKMKSEWKVKAEKLNQANRTVETVGPIQNYRLQYELIAQAVGPQTGVPRKNIKFKQFTIYPSAGELGESLEVALAPGSQFNEILRRHEPRKTTVSIWVYPDSFTAHNEFKKMLHQSGFQMASWPLDHGKKISGGPDGFKTSAQ